MIVVAVCAPPICAIEETFYCEEVTLTASESLRDFMQGLSSSSSEEELSLRCRLRPHLFVPVGQCGTVYPACASRKHSPVGMQWHNFPKKVDILSMLALSWSSVCTSLFVVPIGSVCLVGSRDKARSLPAPSSRASDCACHNGVLNLNAKNG